MNSAVIVMTWKNVHFFRLKMKNAVDNILVSGYASCKFFIK